MADPSMTVLAATPPAKSLAGADITASAVAFLTQARFEALSPRVLEISRRCILDSTGLILSGLGASAISILADFAREQGGAEQAILLGHGPLRVPVQVAARVLGTAGHVHDFDDTQVSHDPAHVYGLLTHPSVPPFSAALAISDMLGGVSGRMFATAFNYGFELGCKISEWMQPDHYLRGHHTSGTVGTFSACAAACVMLDLDATATARALGIAGSFAAGIRCNFGTMTKPLHVGRAAENGVLAALLAARGYTADPTVLDGPWGFPAVLGGGFTPEKVAQGFGNTWSIVDPGVSIKPYPSGILTHQSMDMVKSLVLRADIDPATVERIDFFAGDNILRPIRYRVAKNELQAKFSMAALIAMLVLHRDAGLAQFDDEVISAPEFQDMQQRIHTHADPAINALGFDLIRSRIEVTLKNGQILKAEADTRYRGGPSWPLTDAELRGKYDGCVSRLDPVLTDRIAQAALGLVDAGSTAAFLDLLRQAKVRS
jgi:2-methylcitrate dehydratase PrpD